MSKALFTEATVFAGDDLEVIPQGHVLVIDGTIVEVGRGKEPERSLTGVEVVSLDGRALLPGLIDAHTHVGDSAGAEAACQSDWYSAVISPTSVKNRVTGGTARATVVEGVRHYLAAMLARGVTAFGDFRDGGQPGLDILLEAGRGYPGRIAALGRPAVAPDQGGGTPPSPSAATDRSARPSPWRAEAVALLGQCDGLALATANQVGDDDWAWLRTETRRRGKLLAVHISEAPEAREESERRWGMSDARRVLELGRPDHIVHATLLDDEEVRLLASTGTPAVLCPRSNLVLGLGRPPLRDLVEAGVTLGLGTDNGMLNGPDLFREMDATFCQLRALGCGAGHDLPRRVLRMATVDGARALGLEARHGSIAPGKSADFVLVNTRSDNLRHTRDLMASIVHRADPSDIAAVAVGGKWVFGSPA